MIREAIGFEHTRVGEFHLRLWCRSPEPLLFGSIRRNLELVLVAKIAVFLTYQFSAQAILVAGPSTATKGVHPIDRCHAGQGGASGRRSMASMGWLPLPRRCTYDFASTSLAGFGQPVVLSVLGRIIRSSPCLLYTSKVIAEGGTPNDTNIAD